MNLGFGALKHLFNGKSLPGMDIGNGPGGVQSVDPSLLGPTMGAPASYPSGPSKWQQMQPQLQGLLGNMAQQQNNQPPAPPMQNLLDMVPSAGIGRAPQTQSLMAYLQARRGSR